MMIVELEAYWDEESKVWCARGIEESIFTYGATLDELWMNAREAVSLHLAEEIEQGQIITIKLTIKSDAAVTTSQR